MILSEIRRNIGCIDMQENIQQSNFLPNIHSRSELDLLPAPVDCTSPVYYWDGTAT